jgi:hypothetical protein
LAQILSRLSLDPSILNDIKNTIQFPPRLEEEAMEYEVLYKKMIKVG